MRDDNAASAGPTTCLPPARVFVDLQAIGENVRQLTNLAQRKNMGLIAVVKADGYGHGAVEVAAQALAEGADMLAVASIDEAMVLRQRGIDAPVLILTSPYPGTGRLYRQNGFIATVASMDDAMRLTAEIGSDEGRGTDIHVKVDTGMTRLGVFPEQVPDLMQKLMAAGRFRVQGVYSHLATADEVDRSYAETQIAKFDRVVHDMQARGIVFPYRHLLNSSGLLAFESRAANYARVGLSMYGLYPAPHLKSVLTLQPALSFCTQVASVKRVTEGSNVGYGGIYRTTRETTIVTLPVGYANGLQRSYSSHPSVLINGKRLPIVGNICMQQAIVDAGETRVAVGDRVVLVGSQGEDRIPVEQWTELGGITPYEFVTSIGKNTPRAYVSG